MTDMDVAFTTKVFWRNDIGQFAAACERAGTETVKAAIEEGADISRMLAPKGDKIDPRTIPLAASIQSEMTGATSGRWFATARHAAPQEFGGRPHPITGRVMFWWEKEGRPWMPGGNMIQHPGNPAHPYLMPAYEIISKRIMEIAKAKYPG